MGQKTTIITLHSSFLKLTTTPISFHSTLVCSSIQTRALSNFIFPIPSLFSVDSFLNPLSTYYNFDWHIVPLRCIRTKLRVSHVFPMVFLLLLLLSLFVPPLAALGDISEAEIPKIRHLFMELAVWELKQLQVGTIPRSTIYYKHVKMAQLYLSEWEVIRGSVQDQKSLDHLSESVKAHTVHEFLNAVDNITSESYIPYIQYFQSKGVNMMKQDGKPETEGAFAKHMHARVGLVKSSNLNPLDSEEAARMHTKWNAYAQYRSTERDELLDDHFGLNVSQDTLKFLNAVCLRWAGGNLWFVGRCDDSLNGDE